MWNLIKIMLNVVRELTCSWLLLSKWTHLLIINVTHLSVIRLTKNARDLTILRRITKSAHECVCVCPHGCATCIIIKNEHNNNKEWGWLTTKCDGWLLTPVALIISTTHYTGKLELKPYQHWFDRCPSAWHIHSIFLHNS